MSCPNQPLHAEQVLADIRKIDVLRAKNLGDFIFALPAFQALREAYPVAEIVLLARHWHEAFMCHRPGPIDRVLAMPEGAIGDQAGIRADPAEVSSFIAGARAEKFDLLVQIHGGGANSNPFVLQMRARHTIGLRAPGAPALDLCIPYMYFQPEVLRYLEVVALVGAHTAAIEPRVRVMDVDLAEARAVVAEDARPLAVIHPGASAAARRWPPDGFARVGDVLAAHGLRVVVTGVPDEHDVVQRVVDSMRAPAQNTCGMLTVGGLTGLLSRAALLVSNDTGPLHVAMAIGTPTVGIYWCGNMINAGPFTRLWNRPVVSWQVTCRACGVNSLAQGCVHGHPPVDDVTVDEVLGHALDLVQRFDARR